MDFEAILAAEERRERRLPRWVAIARAVRRGRALWDVEAERHRALVVMEPVARDPGELEALARRHLVEHSVREALLGRPRAARGRSLTVGSPAWASTAH